MDFLLHHLLQKSADVHPDLIAVADGPRHVTFEELETASNRLAHLLVEMGVERGARVGIYLDKSLESVVAIYGILKAGAVYVPFDPQAPASRLGFIARNCGIEMLVTGEEKAAEWRELMRQGAPLRALLVLNTRSVVSGSPEGVDLVTAAALEAQPVSPPSIWAIDLDLAYILYTSGSTGDPKGVKLSHGNARAFVDWAAGLCEVGPQDRLSSHAPLHFDLSIFDIFAAAKGSARVVLVPTEALIFPSKVVRFIGREGITIWYSVPSALSMLVQRGGIAERDVEQLRTVFFAGEVFPVKFLRRLMELVPRAQYYNLYGPTETNVCTYYHVPELAPDRVEPIPIGVAIENVEVFAVKDDGERADVGETGELYVRGAGVMQGYWGDPERTAATLVSHPFSGSTREAVHRTGDLVRLDPDGNYVLLGRRDNQIKSRGYRIELGDVEAALYAHPSVLECAVAAVPDDLITNRLKAYVVTSGPLDRTELIRFCTDRIPAYMIPDTFEFRKALPKTSTGKVDHQMLATALSTGHREDS